MPTPDKKRRPGEGGARDDQHDEPSHTGGGSSTALQGEGKTPQKKVPCVFLDAGYHLARIFDMSDAEAGAYFKRLLLAINIGKRGVMPEADEMLDEAQTYYNAKREAGRLGGLSTQGKQSSGASSNASSHSYRHTPKHSDTQLDHRAKRAAMEYPPNAKPTIM